MFANYLYFILALLIYAVESETKSNYRFIDSFLGSSTIILVYILTVLLTFKIFEKTYKYNSFNRSETIFGRIKSTLSISAVAFFGIAVSQFNPTWHINQIKIFQMFPTFSATLALSTFILMLVFLWTVESNYQRKLFGASISTKDYIQSNLSFPLVILITWIFIFIPGDIINALPFDWLKEFFSSLAGSIIYFVLSFLFVLTAGPFLVQKVWGCSSLEDGESRELIEKMCRDLGVRYRDILIWPFFGGTMITAGVMGVFGKFRYILVTPALLRHLTKEELASVVAHEIGHVKHHHLLLYIFFLSGFFMFSNLITDPLINTFQIDSIELIVAILIIAFALYFRFFFGFVMRNFERQADAFVLTVFESADPIIRTFRKITSINRQPEEKPNWHHFSIKERIDFLEKADWDKNLIKKHNSKVKKIVIPYMVTFAALIVFTFTYSGSAVYENHYDNLVVAEKSLQTDEIVIANALGDFYYTKKIFEKTIKSYSKVIEADPVNTHAMNNLAWLYLTCPDEKYQDHQKALMLAERAASLKRTKEIMDTLAEAFYKNRMFKKAVDASRESVRLSGNQDYYIKQLEKFERLADQTPI